MPDETDRPADRRGLSPAAWGALSAVAVALIGAVATVAPMLMKDRPAPTPEAQAGAATTPAAPPVAEAKPETPTAPDPSMLAGRWIGVAQAPDAEPFSLGLDIPASCRLHGACGTIVVTNVPCKGRLTLIAAGAEGFEFGVDDFEPPSDMNVCKPGGGEVLRVGPDDTLLYTATYSGAKGVLRRRE